VCDLFLVPFLRMPEDLPFGAHTLTSHCHCPPSRMNLACAWTRCRWLFEPAGWKQSSRRGPSLGGLVALLPEPLVRASWQITTAVGRARARSDSRVCRWCHSTIIDNCGACVEGCESRRLRSLSASALVVKRWSINGSRGSARLPLCFGREFRRSSAPLASQMPLHIWKEEQVRGSRPARVRRTPLILLRTATACARSLSSLLPKTSVLHLEVRDPTHRLAAVLLGE
jgi:hypothetical protein